MAEGGSGRGRRTGPHPGAAGAGCRRRPTISGASSRSLAAGDRPVIAGPFLGEVGFELLYWIPFLRWSVEQFPALGDRLVVTSRGGTRGWYGDLANRYVDVLEIVDFDELTSGMTRLKQRGEITPFEHRIHTGISDALGLEDAAILHPTPMWRAYYRNLKARESAFVDAVGSVPPGESVPGLNSSYRQLEQPSEGKLQGVLPDDYAAVRFYFRPSFPDTELNREVAAQLVKGLATRLPVVLLNNGMDFDEHRDIDLASFDNVISLREHMTPADNLEVQSIALSRARLFAGTYGGLAYLAPHYGVPSVGFADDTSYLWPWHLGLAKRIFSGEDWGTLSVFSSMDEEAVPEVLGMVSAGEGEEGR